MSKHGSEQNCPFMAIKMDKSRSSSGPALAERGKFQVMCPVSGRQSIFGSEDLVSLDASSDSSQETEQVPNSPFGRRLERHTSLGAIIEEVDDDGVQSNVSSKKSLILNGLESINAGQSFHRHSSRSFAPEKFARRSESPEHGSMRSMSQASSTAGIEVRMSGAGSRWRTQKKNSDIQKVFSGLSRNSLTRTRFVQVR